MKKIWILSFILLFTVGSILSGCSSDAENSAEKVLKLNLGGEPSSLDPAQAFDEDSLDVTNALFEGLMKLDQNHQPQPAVAKEVQASPDGLTYTFKLNETKWSNGEPVTAHDFEYAWKRVLDPNQAADPAFLLYFIKGAEEYNTGKGTVDQVAVKAKDDLTLEVHLARPTPSFLQLVSYPVYFPINKKAAEANQNLYNEATTYVSNGPFKMSEWKHDDRIKLVKNDQYHKKDLVKLSGIQFSMVSDGKTIYSLFQTKELDVVGKGVLPSDLVGSLIKSGEINISDGNGLSFFRLNVTKEPFTNAKVRKAFALAIDRKLITEQVIGGGEKPAYAYVAPSVPNQFREKGGDLLQDGNIEEAKKLLAEGMKEEGWSKLPTVTLLYSNSSDKNKTLAEAIQEMYRKNLGVEVTLQAKEKKVYFDDQKKKNYIMTTSSFLADYNDAYNYLESFQTDHSMNRTGWSHPQYDELLKKAANTANIDERDQYLHQAEKILFDEVPVFPLYYYNSGTLEQKGVSGILRHPVGPSDYSQADKQ